MLEWSWLESRPAIDLAVAAAVVLIASTVFSVRFVLANAAKRRAWLEGRLAYLDEPRHVATRLPDVGAGFVSAFDAVALSEDEVRRLLEQLFDELDSNINALNEIVRAWNEMIQADARNASARREFASKAKRAGAKLSTRFWDRHSDFILHSGLPAQLKNAFRRVYEATGRLKAGLERMSATPSLEALGEISGLIDDMLEAFEKLHEAFEAMPSR